MVANHQPPRRIEQQQALRHVVDGLVEALLFERQALLRRRVILRQTPHDEEEQARDQQHRNDADADQELHLLLPVRERGGRGRGGDDHDREIRQRARGNQAVLAVDGARQPRGRFTDLKDLLLICGAELEILAHHAVGMGIAREQRAIAMVHRDGGAGRKRDGREEALEIRRRDRAGHDAQEFAVGTGDLARDDGSPAGLKAALQELDPETLERRAGFEGLEEVPVGDPDIRDRPVFRGIDQDAVGVEDVDTGDVAIGAQPEPQHVVPVGARQLRPERVGRGDSGCLDLRDHVALDRHEVLELLVEMTGHQQHGVFELVLGARQSTIAEGAGHDRGADRDCRDQQRAAGHEPADRAAAAHGSLHVDRIVRVFHLHWNHWRGVATGNAPNAPGRMKSYFNDVELTLAIGVNGR